MFPKIINLLKYINVWGLPSRIGRVQYFIISTIYGMLGFIMQLIYPVKILNFKLIIFYGIVALAVFFLIQIPLMVKRLHDMSLRGWWTLTLIIPLMINFLDDGNLRQALMPVVPFVVLVLYLVLFFAPGTKGSNRFGSASKTASKIELVITVVLAALYVLCISYILYMAVIYSYIAG